MKSPHAGLALAAGLFLLVPAWIGLSATGGPTVLSPLPALTALPAMLGLAYGALGVPSLLFFLWNPGLFRGEARIPKRSYWLFGTATGLGAIWFAGSWKWGLHYQGARYTYTVCAGNLVWAVLIGGLLLGFRSRQASFRTNLLLHWVLFAWLAWYAFPYLGELL